MGTPTAERILEREVPHQPKNFIVRAGDRTQLQRCWIFFGGVAHVVELDVTAELHRPLEGLRDSKVNLGARARVLVVAVGQFRGAEILTDLEPAQNSVGRLDRLVYLVNVRLAFGELPGRRRGR